MKNRKNNSAVSDALEVKGFFRLKLGKPVDARGTLGRVIDSDSGWRQNQIVNNGYQSFLQFAIIASAGSLTANYAALGTGTVPATNATSLNGEITDAANCRCALTTGTSGSKTVNFTFTLNSGIATTSHNISNVGLFNGSTTNAGTMMAGNTYASSALASNQAVNGTYQIIFG